METYRYSQLYLPEALYQTRAAGQLRHALLVSLHQCPAFAIETPEARGEQQPHFTEYEVEAPY